MHLSFVFILLISWGAIAQEKSAANGVEREVLQVGEDISQQDPNLDAFYKRGSFLVYDCLTRHWVCTQELEYQRCQMQRKEAILDYEDELPCAYFDKFKLRKDCQKRQQELTDLAVYEQFCLNPEKVENRLTF